jgi:hypothetical protein
VNIKAQGLLNGARWIEEEYGAPTLATVLARCSPAVRDRCASAIAINWHPVEEYVEFLAAAEAVIGKGDGRVAEQIGRASARQNLRGVVVRFALYVAKPDFLLKRLAGLWSQFNDEGGMRLLEFEETNLVMEIFGIAQPNALFCCAFTGWCHEVAVASGISSPVARHTECRAHGGARCIWEVRSREASRKDPKGAPSSTR